MKPDSEPTSFPFASLDRTMLVLSAAVILLSFLLQVDEPRVRLAFWPGWVLPESCLARFVAGIDCPGCGLTRSFIYLADGNWSASLRANRVGWLLACLVVAQIPFRVWSLRTGGSAVPAGVRAAVFCTLLLVLIANWIYELWA